ncbi:MAG: chemotaxis protein CheB [Planctomycetes bacterium]|nr:chemotaxis protein CheB [Planctomycetota bacterium]
MGSKLAVIGASKGGLDAVRILLSGLPRAFPIPVAIVQHRSKEPGDDLTRLVQESSALPVRQVEDKDKAHAGHVYLAPADYHLLVERGWFALSTEPPVNYSRPSVDALFETAAESYGPEVIAVVLTGASSDGARGVRRIKDRGGYVVVQRPETAESEAMPAAAIAAARVDRILPVTEISGVLVMLVAEEAR